MSAYPSDFDTSYCRHGYPFNEDCPDCDSSTFLPSYFNAMEEAEELTAETREMVEVICDEVSVNLIDGDTVAKHPDFVVIATASTYGEGTFLPNGRTAISQNRRYGWALNVQH